MIVGTSRLEPVYRVLSFLVLGTVLLMVSLLFTQMRKRQRKTRRSSRRRAETGCARNRGPHRSPPALERPGFAAAANWYRELAERRVIFVAREAEGGGAEGLGVVGRRKRAVVRATS